MEAFDVMEVHEISANCVQLLYQLRVNFVPIPQSTCQASTNCLPASFIPALSVLLDTNPASWVDSKPPPSSGHKWLQVADKWPQVEKKQPQVAHKWPTSGNRLTISGSRMQHPGSMMLDPRSWDRRSWKIQDPISWILTQGYLAQETHENKLGRFQTNK